MPYLPVTNAKLWFFRLVLTPYVNAQTKAIADEPVADTHPDAPRDAMPYGDTAFAAQGLRAVLCEAADMIQAFHESRDEPCDLKQSVLISRLASLRVSMSYNSGSYIMHGSYTYGERLMQYAIYVTHYVEPGHDARDVETKPVGPLRRPLPAVTNS